MKFGLEIHQRLDTPKLFCSCRGMVLEKKQGDLVVDRKLHPVFSELGEVDFTSREQHKKDIYFEYNFFNDTDCLVELDEEPPHELNKEALLVALGMCFHLNARILDEIHVMRKIIIDGSNTSGFQRTAIIALNGYLDTSRGKVRIMQIALEEESSGIVQNTPNKVVYTLDRLGIPLIEITTAPDIKDSEHLAEVAKMIGMMLRTTGKVARGIGTIRQDVNVSTEGGARVEIKGAQELKQLPILVENELKRQKELISLFGELKNHSKEIKFSKEFFDVTSFFSGSITQFIINGLKNGEKAITVILPYHNGFLGKELLPDRRYGTELSEYAKTAGVAGIIHSDEDFKKYGLDDSVKNSIRSAIKCSANDAFVIVISKEEKAKFALEKVLLRVKEMRVLEETRKANPDSTTSYMRPLSGGARMYPETDVPAITINPAVISEAKNMVGENLEEKKEKLMLLLNNKEMTEKILKSRNLKLFESLVISGADPMLVANTLENTLVSLRRKGVEIKDVQTALTALFEEFKRGSFVRAAIEDILAEMSHGKSVQTVLAEKQLYRIKGEELKKIAKENNFDVAKIMQKYRLRVEPKDLQMLNK